VKHLIGSLTPEQIRSAAQVNRRTVRFIQLDPWGVFVLAWFRRRSR
jgi:hypothetical protein